MNHSDKQPRIYADHAASTPVDPRVFEVMLPYHIEIFGNAGGIHQEGVAAKEVVSKSRQSIAKMIGCGSHEIIFTSGGTESNNLAIFGLVEALLQKGKTYKDMHFITLAIEHASVYECFSVLEKKGARVTTIPVTESGVVDPEVVVGAIEEDTVLISAMYANSEIGTIQPIRDIGLLLKKYREEHNTAFPYFHTDACQGPEYLSIQVSTLLVDYMTIDAQKIYGPKGSGFLYRRHEAPLAPIMYGGRQEQGLRPGTPPTAVIVGVAKALEISSERREVEVKRLTLLRDMFIKEVLSKIPGSVLNGHKSERLPNNANISFPGKSAEYLVLMLDQRGIAAATRSACHVGETGGSHVVRALGRSPEEVLGAVRFTFGRSTTEKDIARIVEVLTEIVT